MSERPRYNPHARERAPKIPERTIQSVLQEAYGLAREKAFPHNVWQALTNGGITDQRERTAIFHIVKKELEENQELAEQLARMYGKETSLPVKDPEKVDRAKEAWTIDQSRRFGMKNASEK
mgnify:CR=1 FL=1